MNKTGPAFCTVDFNESTEEIQVRVHVTSQGGLNMKTSIKKVSREQIDAACKEYWDFVNLHVETGVVTGNDEKRRRAFLDDLMAYGSELRELLMDNATSLRLWNIARSTEILLIATRLLHVPWEALFNPVSEVRGFLADCCVVTRWPGEHGDSERGFEPTPASFGSERLTCLDPLLIDKVQLNQMSIEKALAIDGEVVYVTEDKNGLVKKVEGVQFIHWICEHHENGLRLSETSYYTERDTKVHRFPAGTILVLSSCKSGGHLPTGPSIAATICAASNCTVVAPSSLIAAVGGAQFTQSINAKIRAANEKMTVAQLWRSIREPLRLHDNTKPVPPESCFTLWYGIYGNGEASVRG